jgi:hypothetical protein
MRWIARPTLAEKPKVAPEKLHRVFARRIRSDPGQGRVTAAYPGQVAEGNPATGLASGAVDTERGIRELIVGTGGRSLRPIAAMDANSEVADWSTFGILKLTLRASSYSWQFLPVAGGTFTDSGTTACH